MRSDPLHLLKRLDPPVRPASSGRSPNAPLESRGFDELLTLVARGEVQSEQPVTSALIGETALSPDELHRLGEAADLAEAAGFRTALVLMEERSFVLDVNERRVLRDLTNERTATIALDGAVRIVPEESIASGPRDPRTTIMPPAVAARHGLDAARDGFTDSSNRTATESNDDGGRSTPHAA